MLSIRHSLFSPGKHRTHGSDDKAKPELHFPVLIRRFYPDRRRFENSSSINFKNPDHIRLHIGILSIFYFQMDISTAKGGSAECVRAFGTRIAALFRRADFYKQAA